MWKFVLALLCVSVSSFAHAVSSNPDPLADARQAEQFNHQASDQAQAMESGSDKAKERTLQEFLQDTHGSRQTVVFNAVLVQGGRGHVDVHGTPDNLVLYSARAAELNALVDEAGTYFINAHPQPRMVYVCIANLALPHDLGCESEAYDAVSFGHIRFGTWP